MDPDDSVRRLMRIPVMWAPIPVMWASVGAKRRWLCFYII